MPTADTPALPLLPGHFLRGLAHAPFPLDQLYLVGGGVRDLLLGRGLKDVDLACRDAEAVALGLAKALNGRFVPLGRDHDPPSFRVMLRDADQTGPHPGFSFLDVTEIHGQNIFDDLARRDFTVNAMALPLARLPEALAGMESSSACTNGDWSDDLLDPHSGRLDLLQGLIRRTGPRTLAEDALRILRGFRLRAQLGWAIEPATLEDMARHAPALAGISGERVRSELLLILESPKGGRLLAEMDQAGVLAVLFPELREMRGCSQNHFHHLDVLGHSLSAAEQCDDLLANPGAVFGELQEGILAALEGWRLPWLKLAVLLHDIGKPGTRAPGPGKQGTRRITFYGHDALGAAMAESVAVRLRLSTAERTYMTGLIRHHLHVGVLLRPGAKLKARLRWMRRLGPDLIPSVLLCLADIRATLGPASSLQEHQSQEARSVALVREYLEQAEITFSVAPLVTGHDLQALGQLPGPPLGHTLRLLREAQDAGEIETRQEALALARHLVSRSVAGKKESFNTAGLKKN